tara:strand:+ start:239 stop:601 length:363 start_codon:yes stop_codon:yes gene_type:complete
VGAGLISVNYILSYFVYLLGASFLIFGARILFLQSNKKYFRDLCMIILAVVLFTPINTYVGEQYYAPAIFVSFYEGIFLSSDYGFQRGAAPILAILLIVLCLYHVIWVVKFVIGKLRKGS